MANHRCKWNCGGTDCHAPTLRTHPKPIDVRAQIEKTRREVSRWPKWLRDCAVWAVAGMPRRGKS
jgi:hypothetical protein